MGELEEKDLAPAASETTTSPTTPQVLSIDEPKETEQLLPTELKEDASTPPAAAAEPLKPSPTSVTVDIEPTATIIFEVPPIQKEVDTPKAEGAPKIVTKEGREVKPKKIPIGGIKMPGFFTRPKSKPEGDGADSELLNKEVEPPIEASKVPTEGAEKKDADAKAPQKSFFSALKFRNPFAKRDAVAKEEGDVEQAVTEEIKTNGEMNNVSPKIIEC